MSALSSGLFLIGRSHGSWKIRGFTVVDSLGFIIFVFIVHDQFQISNTQGAVKISAVLGLGAVINQ